jgi:molecular chaperone GrpE
MKEKAKEDNAKKMLKAEPELEQLRAEFDSLQKEKDELFAKLQRVSADYANFEKRASRLIADTIAYEKESIIRTLLPVLDNFEHTLDKAHSADSIEAVIKGIRIIYDQMLDILKSHGIEQIQSLGEKFDPSLHEAMMQIYDSNKELQSVVEEYQKGFKLNGRVIRPSKVIVNKPPAEGAGQPVEEKTPEDGREKAEGAE